MTNTITKDVTKTIKQINEIAESGANLVRVSCPDKDPTQALKEIMKSINIPLKLIFIFIMLSLKQQLTA